MSLSRLYYEDEVKESQSSTNVLLLPTVKSNEGDEGKQLEIRGIRRVGVQRMLQSLKIEKCTVFNDESIYCDLAERLKKKKTEMTCIE